jgi:hypothetical protein
LRVESVRQDFDVSQQTKYINSYGEQCLVQRLHEMISESPRSSTAIDEPSPTLTGPEPIQASSSANIEFTASTLESSLVATSLGFGHDDSATIPKQPPKRDLLARKLDQLSDSSVSSTEVREILDLATLALSLCFGIHSISNWTLTRSARRVLRQIR